MNRILGWESRDESARAKYPFFTCVLLVSHSWSTYIHRYVGIGNDKQTALDDAVIQMTKKVDEVNYVYNRSV